MSRMSFEKPPVVRPDPFLASKSLFPIWFYFVFAAGMVTMIIMGCCSTGDQNRDEYSPENWQVIRTDSLSVPYNVPNQGLDLIVSTHSRYRANLIWELIGYPDSTHTGPDVEIRVVRSYTIYEGPVNIIVKEKLEGGDDR